MSLPPNIAKLYAIAATLGGKRLKLSGNLLAVKNAVIHNMGAPGSATLSLELILDEDDQCRDKTCSCVRCESGRLINKSNATAVCDLMADGLSPGHRLLLDSSFASKDGFSVKVRNLNTGTCHVGEGKNLSSAIAIAATDALKPATP